jgi:hypothetical protein
MPQKDSLVLQKKLTADDSYACRSSSQTASGILNELVSKPSTAAFQFHRKPWAAATLARPLRDVRQNEIGDYARLTHF